MIFPWADGGNLLNEWERLPPHDVGAEKVLWFLEQFVGLCEALEELHTKETQNCIHGDLKPENILIFSQPGSNPIFQIADLGLAAFHIEAHTNMRMASGVGSGTSRYKPPEMETMNLEVSRGRAYDIWSMGCILLEFLVWLTSGYDGLRKFQSSTTYFWDLSRSGSILHSAVEIYLDLAETELASSPVLSDVVLLVKKQLLVQKPERVGAKKLRENLQRIRDKRDGSALSSLTPVRFTLPDAGIDSTKRQAPAPHIVGDRLAVQGQQDKPVIRLGKGVDLSDQDNIDGDTNNKKGPKIVLTGVSGGSDSGGSHNQDVSLIYPQSGAWANSDHFQYVS